MTNAIVPQVAAAFIRAVMRVLAEEERTVFIRAGVKSIQDLETSQ